MPTDSADLSFNVWFLTKVCRDLCGTTPSELGAWVPRLSYRVCQTFGRSDSEFHEIISRVRADIAVALQHSDWPAMVEAACGATSLKRPGSYDFVFKDLIARIVGAERAACVLADWMVHLSIDLLDEQPLIVRGDPAARIEQLLRPETEVRDSAALDAFNEPGGLNAAEQSFAEYMINCCEDVAESIRRRK